MFPDRLRYVDTVDKVSKLVESTDVKIANLYQQIQNHVNDESKHITDEEKESWNNKLDKQVFDEFQTVLNKRFDDTNDNNISEWSNDDIITYIRLKNYLSNYYTSLQIDLKIQEVYSKIPSLQGYATLKYVTDSIAAINIPNTGLRQSDLDNVLQSYYNKTEINLIVSNLENTLKNTPSDGKDGGMFVERYAISAYDRVTGLNACPSDINDVKITPLSTDTTRGNIDWGDWIEGNLIPTDSKPYLWRISVKVDGHNLAYIPVISSYICMTGRKGPSGLSSPWIDVDPDTIIYDPNSNTFSSTSISYAIKSGTHIVTATVLSCSYSNDIENATEGSIILNTNSILNDISIDGSTTIHLTWYTDSSKSNIMATKDISVITNGTNGKDGNTYWIDASPDCIIYDTNTETINPTSISLTAMCGINSISDVQFVTDISTLSTDSTGKAVLLLDESTVISNYKDSGVNGISIILVDSDRNTLASKTIPILRDGENGDSGENVSYFNLSTHVVKKNITNLQQLSYIPNTITYTIIYKGVEYQASLFSSNNLSVETSYDGTTWDTVSSVSGIASSSVGSTGILYFRAKHDTDIIGTDSVVCVEDGNNGVSATEYQLAPISSDMLADTDAENEGTTGTITLKANYREAGLKWQPWSGDLKAVRCIGYADGEAKGSMDITLSSDGTGTCDAENINLGEIAGQYVSINMILFTNTTKSQYDILLTIVVPIAQKGAKGSLGIQGFPGKDGITTTVVQSKNGYLRLVQKPSDVNIPIKYYGGETADLNGDMPQDFVLYSGNNATDTSKWGVYICRKTGDYKWTEIPTSDYWYRIEFNIAGAFNTLIAERGYIDSLTVGQVVVQDEDGKVIGGMTNSDAIPVVENKKVSDINGNNITKNDSIVIWAGVPSGTSLTTAPFYVTKDGAIVAKNLYNSYNNVDLTKGNVYFGKETVKLVDSSTTTVDEYPINKSVPTIISIDSFVADRYVILPYPKDYIGKIVTISIMGGTSSPNGSCFITCVSNENDSETISIGYDSNESGSKQTALNELASIINNDDPQYIAQYTTSISKDDSTKLFALGKIKGSYIEFLNPGTGTLSQYKCENMMSIQLFAAKEGSSYYWRVISGNNDNSNGSIILGGY